MCLCNESDKTEGWLLEKPIVYTSKDNFSQEGIFDVGDRVQRRWLSYGLIQWLESGLFDL